MSRSNYFLGTRKHFGFIWTTNVYANIYGHNGIKTSDLVERKVPKFWDTEVKITRNQFVATYHLWTGKFPPI